MGSLAYDSLEFDTMVSRRGCCDGRLRGSDGVDRRVRTGMRRRRPVGEGRAAGVTHFPLHRECGVDNAVSRRCWRLSGLGGDDREMVTAVS